MLPVEENGSTMAKTRFDCQAPRHLELVAHRAILPQPQPIWPVDLWQAPGRPQRSHSSTEPSSGVTSLRQNSHGDLASLGANTFGKSSPHIRPTQLFQICTTLNDRITLRASPLAQLLMGNGRIFANSAGTAMTYSMSRPVEHIDVFLSHNWATPRLQKFLTLAIHTNFWLALMFAMFTLTVCFLMTALGLLPVISQYVGPDTNACGLGVVLTCPVFLTVSLFGHQLQRCVGYQSPNCFLDKTCIHQTDVDLKREGIEKLGAFLMRSTSIVAVYTDLYLTKLWTVYEVACFLILHPRCNMIVLPVALYISIVVFMLIGYAIVLSLYIGTLLRTQDPSRRRGYRRISMLIRGCFLNFILLVLQFGAQRYGRQQRDMWRHVQNFDIRDTACFCKEDRPLVEANVVALMKYTGRVCKSASVSETLAAFNMLVRQHVPRTLHISCGAVGVPYRYVLAITVCLFLVWSVDTLAATIAIESPSARHIFIQFAHNLYLSLVGFPLGFAAYFKIASRCPQLRGYRSALAFVMRMVIGNMICLSTYAPLHFADHAAEGSNNIQLMLFLLCFLCLTLIAAFVYHPRKPEGAAITATVETTM